MTVKELRDYLAGFPDHLFVEASLIDENGEMATGRATSVNLTTCISYQSQESTCVTIICQSGVIWPAGLNT